MTLTPEQVQTQQKILTQVLQDNFPGVDIQHGVMHDLVQYVNAIFAANTAQQLDDYLASRSLLALQENPNLATEEAVDHVLSNFNLQRKAGSFTTGNVTLEFSKDQTVLIPLGARFISGTYTYETTESVLAYSSTSTGAIKLKKVTSGCYGVTVPVIATSTGAGSYLIKGTTVTCQTPIAYLVKAYATDNFNAGVDTESNTELLQRLYLGMAARCWGSRHNIHALLADKFPSLVDVSPIGFGDKEMLRDKDSIFPIAVGGKTDVWVKLAPYLQTRTLEVTTDPCIRSGLYTEWSVYLPAEVCRGCYGIQTIKDDTREYEIKSCLWVSETEETDVAYTSHAGMCVTFRTMDVIQEPGTTFEITLFEQPNIAEAQEYITQRDIVPLQANVLIRAAIPAIVSVTVSLTEAVANEEAIKDAIVQFINTRVFTKEVTSAQIAAIIAKLVPSAASIRDITLQWDIYNLDNTIYRSATSSVLTLPDSGQLTARTIALFTDKEQITLRRS